jgi:teichoic acid transport system permease protein
MTAGVMDEDERTPVLARTTPSAEVEATAARFGLHRAGARLPLGEYTRELWRRRRFITAYSTASNAVGYERSFLGQAWQVLTPLLNVAVYYLIFGLLLHTNRGIHNFIAYLAVGVFVFSFCTGSVTAGAKAITGNLGLVRALQFPRAVLPVSTTLVALLQLIYSLVIMVPIVLITGERPRWQWFELIPAIGLQSMFCLGLAFVMARIGAKVPDTVQTLPFVTRVWMYMSGVMFSVNQVAKGHAPWVHTVLSVNPGNLFVSLPRHALIAGNPIGFSHWLQAAAWAVGMLVVGCVYFWRGEEEYGNV